MSVFYLDSSAWVKRYAQEKGSERVQRLFDQRERLGSSSLGYVEAAAALCRRLSEEDLARFETRLKLDWQEMTRLPVSAEVIDEAVSLARRHKRRGADAVHLATALTLGRALAEVNATVVLVTSDEELLQAARAAGLQVENPVWAL